MVSVTGTGNEGKSTVRNLRIKVITLRKVKMKMRGTGNHVNRTLMEVKGAVFIARTEKKGTKTVLKVYYVNMERT